MLATDFWCPRTVPTQVNSKNLGIERWGIARDTNLTLPKPLKSQLLIVPNRMTGNNTQFSAEAAKRMALMPVTIFDWCVFAS